MIEWNGFAIVQTDNLNGKNYIGRHEWVTKNYKGKHALQDPEIED